MSNRHPSWAENRLLQVINFARTAEQIYQHPALRDDPASGSSSGYIIGAKVAQYIIDYKANLARRRYERAAQLLEVKGLGEDKLNDLLFSFSIGADEAFRDTLFNGILFENWEVQAHSISYGSANEFKAIASNGEHFRRAVADLHIQTLTNWSERERQQIRIIIQQAYQENYLDGHIGAFQLALWWYLFDYDNWFSYEKMKSACENYLSYHSYGTKSTQLRILRLQGATAIQEFQRDLMIPVIANEAEQKITIWEVQLND
ncbi:MAG: hypothetical protein AAGI49_07245 [Bacteroidota bacterium]